MDIKTPIIFGMVGAITVASVGAGYGLRAFSPPGTLPMAMTALSTASLSTVSFNTITGKAIEIIPPEQIKVTQGSTTPAFADRDFRGMMLWPQVPNASV